MPKLFYVSTPNKAHTKDWLLWINFFTTSNCYVFPGSDAVRNIASQQLFFSSNSLQPRAPGMPIACDSSTQRNL